jgi:hypothetical protein
MLLFVCLFVCVAQAFIKEYKSSMVKNTCHVRHVGWKTATCKKKRHKVYYPCVRLPYAESRLLFDLGKNKCGVRYLGHGWASAGQFEQIVPSTFHSLHLAATTANTTTTTATGEGAAAAAAAAATTVIETTKALNLLKNITDEECLKFFLDQEFGEAPSVDKRVEELVIQRTWDMVQENQRAKEEEQRIEQDNIAKIAAAVKQSAAATAATTKLLTSPTKQAAAAKGNDADSDSDDDDDDDVMAMLSPGSKRKKLRLRPGDIVEYYLPGRVFGNPHVLTSSVILGVNAKGPFPLNLETGDFLERDHKVRRLARWYKGGLVDEAEDSHFLNLSGYELRTAGEKELVAFQNRVKKMKQTRQDHAKSMDGFWQRGQCGKEKQDEATSTENPKNDDDDNNNKTEEAKADVKAVGRPPATKVASTSSQNNNNDPATTWRKRLAHLLQETEERMKKKRRFTPKITPAEFQMVIQVWSLLQDRNSSTRTMDLQQAVQILVEELDGGMSELRVEAILQGDPHYKLSERNKLEILEVLKDWIDKQPQPQEEEQPSSNKKAD